MANDKKPTDQSDIKNQLQQRSGQQPTMQIRKAERKKAKARVGISGPSGSGKTVSALFLAYGITGDWEKIGLIDTENRSADLYTDVTISSNYIGDFLKIDLEPPYTPEKYIEAIHLFEKHGVEVIIVDSLTHAWAGEGGLLDQQGNIAKRTGNSYTAWRDITPLHNQLVESILKSSCHVIATLRSKTEHVMIKEGDKTIVKKLGMAPIQRDGLEYEFTLMFELDTENYAGASKDRTNMFKGRFITIKPEVGKELLNWLEKGVDEAEERRILLTEVKSLWNKATDKEDDEDGFNNFLTGKGKTQDTISRTDLDNIKTILLNRIEQKNQTSVS